MLRDNLNIYRQFDNMSFCALKAECLLHPVLEGGVVYLGIKILGNFGHELN